MSGLHLGEALGVPRRWRRTAAWLTVVGCLLPLTAGWLYGVLAVSVLFARAPGLLLLSYTGFACAALGIATLWSVIVPRAVGRLPTQRLRPWQVLGLQSGGAVGLIILVYVAINARHSELGSGLLFLTPIAWSLVAALLLAVEADE